MPLTKEWDWKKVDETDWIEPSEESYYLVNHWKNKKFVDFMDLGCGKGRHSILFAQNDFNVESVDLSEHALNSLKKIAIDESYKINTTLANMMELPYKNERFDCLLAYHVISHTDSEGIIKILSEINRVLKPNGEFFITLCSKKSQSFINTTNTHIDDNTIIKNDDGPEKGIPHYYSDDENVFRLMKENKLISLKLVNDIIFDSKYNKSWHYFILGSK